LFVIHILLHLVSLSFTSVLCRSLLALRCSHNLENISVALNCLHYADMPLFHDTGVLCVHLYFSALQVVINILSSFETVTSVCMCTPNQSLSHHRGKDDRFVIFSDTEASCSQFWKCVVGTRQG